MGVGSRSACVYVLWYRNSGPKLDRDAELSVWYRKISSLSKIYYVTRYSAKTLTQWVFGNGLTPSPKPVVFASCRVFFPRISVRSDGLRLQPPILLHRSSAYDAPKNKRVSWLEYALLMDVTVTGRFFWARAAPGSRFALDSLQQPFE